MKRVLLADDHGIVLQGVRRLLEQDGTFVVEAEAQSAREVLCLVAERTFDLLVLDLSLPGGGGLEVLGRLRQLAPKVRVVVYSMYPESQYARVSLDAGARAYVCKARDPETLLDALAVAARGGVYVSGDPSAEEAEAPEPNGSTELTAREEQVLQLLSEARSPSQIAAELAVSRSTVSSHIGQLKRKLNVSSIGGLVRRAIERV